MKHLRNLVLFVMLASAQFAYSGEACDPCDPCYTTTECDLCNVSFCDMEFELYVDALYWHSNADTFFAENNDDVCPDYSWGWRIGGSAYWNTWDFGFRYTAFDASADLSLTPSEDVNTWEKKIDFKVFDLEVGRACCVCEGILFRPFFGGKFADIEHSETLTIGDSVDTLYKRKFKGSGLYVGADTRWQICSFDVCDRSIPVALVSRVSTGVMDGDFKQQEGESDEDLQEDCQFVPVHEVYAGLEFRMCDLCGAEGFMQLGYEAQYWGWREASSDSDIAHLGLGGLVLRFGANF